MKEPTLRMKANAVSESEDGRKKIDYFEQYKKGQEIYGKYDSSIRKAEADAGSISAVRFDKVKVDTTPDVHAAFEDTEFVILSLKEKRDSLRDRLLELRTQISDIIDAQVNDPKNNLRLKMYYIEGLSYQKIADREDCMSSTVRDNVLAALGEIDLPENAIFLDL